MSYLPPPLITALRQQIAPFSPVVELLQGNFISRHRPIFHVPANFSSDDIHIQFVFQGKGTGAADVVVTVPVDPFVYTMDPYTRSQRRMSDRYYASGAERESLIWPGTANGANGDVLGLVRTLALRSYRVAHALRRSRTSSRPCTSHCTSRTPGVHIRSLRTYALRRARPGRRSGSHCHHYDGSLSSIILCHGYGANARPNGLGWMIFSYPLLSRYPYSAHLSCRHHKDLVPVRVQ